MSPIQANELIAHYWVFFPLAPLAFWAYLNIGGMCLHSIYFNIMMTSDMWASREVVLCDESCAFKSHHNCLCFPFVKPQRTASFVLNCTYNNDDDPWNGSTKPWNILVYRWSKTGSVVPFLYVSVTLISLNYWTSSSTVRHLNTSVIFSIHILSLVP